MLKLIQSFGGWMSGEERDLSGEKIIFFIITIRVREWKGNDRILELGKGFSCHRCFCISMWKIQKWGLRGEAKQGKKM